MSYIVVAVNPLAYKAQLMDLWNRNHPDLAALLPKRFAWIYEKNLYGVPKCWLLKHNRTDKFVGATSLIPRRIYVHGKPIMAGIAADMVMDKEHRTLGPALMLQRALLSSCEKGECQLIYGFSPPVAYPVQTKAGFKLIGNAVRMVRPLKTLPIIERQKGKLAATFLSPLFDLILNTSASFTYFRQRLSTKIRFSYSLLDHFDERFDHFWQKIPVNNQIIGERTALYLNWRYAMSPYNSHKVFTLIDKEENIYGYIVYSDNEEIAHIYDICALKFGAILLYFFYRKLKTTDVHSISFMLLEDCFLTKMLTHNLFFKRPEDLTVIAYARSELDFFLQLPSHWHLFAGDKDIG